MTPQEQATIAQMGREIDDTIAAIYARYTRFQTEYELREAQAQAFKDAGYTGTVPAQVAAFATPAGLSATAATDLILSQAYALRGALPALGVLRMRKYEVLGAATVAAAATAHIAIRDDVATIEGTLP